MTAAEVKDALRRRHPAVAQHGFVGQWTTIEEWQSIDFLAFNAWTSGGPKYGRVGYEVKVSRADYRRELRKPGKRAAAVHFCHEFYFAVPDGLLKPDEVAFREPPGGMGFTPFERQRCPGAYGSWCSSGWVRFGTVGAKSKYDTGDFDGRRWRRTVDYRRSYEAPCPTCRGTGWIAESMVVRTGAPSLWVPNDVGLLVVYPNGATRVARKAPRRTPTSRIADRLLADLARWISVRPDPRHAPFRKEADVYAGAV